MPHLEVQHLLEGGASFNVDMQRCGAYKSLALIWGLVLIKGNTVFDILYQNKDKNLLCKLDCFNIYLLQLIGVVN